jgi:AcrR family transcriptional regulator
MNARREILDAATALFSERGFAAVSTKEIAKRAHVHEATIFRKFKSKAAIEEAIIGEHIDQEKVLKVAHAIDKSPDIDTCLRLAAGFYSDVLKPEFSRLHMRLRIHSPEDRRLQLFPVREAVLLSIERWKDAHALRDVDAVAAERMFTAAIYILAVSRSLKVGMFRKASLREVGSICDIWLHGMLRKQALASEEN